MSRWWRSPISAPAMSGATPPSSAPTICCPAISPFYEWSMKLWEGLEQDLNYNAMVSQRGVLNVFHSDPQRDAYARRGNAMRLHGVDAELLDREQVRALVPFVDFDNARFPIRGGLLQRRGGTVRHDAVAWGYARRRRQRGVDIIQNCEVTGFRIEGGRSHRRRDREGLHRRQESRRSPVAGNSTRVAAMAGLRLPIESHVAAGLRLRGREAGDRRGDDVRRRAFLCQPVGQGRAGVRRRHRRLQFLCPARQSAGGRGRGRRRHGADADDRALAHRCAPGAG